MLPKYLKIHGFRSYVDAEIDFAQYGNSFCVIGQNGAGKSSILNAITTALYGMNDCTDAKGSGLDKCINLNCENFEIQFSFIMNDSEYLIITRKFRNESKELELYIDGINQSEKVTETQEKINNILKMNYNTFLDTICLSQGGSGRFMQKKPAERKETLAQILDIQKYELYEKEAKEMKKSLKNTIVEIENKIDFVKSYECDINELQNQIEEKEKQIAENDFLIADLNSQIEKITQQRLEYENAVKQIHLLKQTREKLTNKVNSLKSSITTIKNSINGITISEVDYSKEINSIEEEIKSCHNKLTEKKEKISEWNTNISFYKKEYNENKAKFKKLQDYDKATCEFCYNEITPEHKRMHLIKFRDICKANTAKIQESEKIIEQYNEEITVLVQKEKSLSVEKNKLTKEANAKVKAEFELKSLKEKLTYQEKELAEYDEQLQENLKIEINEIEEKTFDDFDLKKQLKELNEYNNNSKVNISVLTNKIAQSKENADKIVVLEKELKQKKQIYSDYTAISTAFGKSGIPANIIENDIAGIEMEINKVLGILTDNSMSVKFVTTKATANGKKTIDTLDIMVNDVYGTRSYETYSGGEKFRVDFACHIGLAKFLTQRSGATIDFLIVDEGLGSQDDTAKQKFIESIQSLGKFFKQVMVITHIQDLQNAFEKRMLVYKDQLKGSKIDLVE